MQDMKLRTFPFSVEVGRLIMELPFNVINKSYGAQLVRSSSSVGADSGRLEEENQTPIF